LRTAGSKRGWRTFGAVGAAPDLEVADGSRVATREHPQTAGVVHADLESEIVIHIHFHHVAIEQNTEPLLTADQFGAGIVPHQVLGDAVVERPTAIGLRRRSFSGFEHSYRTAVQGKVVNAGFIDGASKMSEAFFTVEAPETEIDITPWEVCVLVSCLVGDVQLSITPDFYLFRAINDCQLKPLVWSGCLGLERFLGDLALGALKSIAPRDPAAFDMFTECDRIEFIPILDRNDARARLGQVVKAHPGDQGLVGDQLRSPGQGEKRDRCCGEAKEYAGGASAHPVHVFEISLEVVRTADFFWHMDATEKFVNGARMDAPEAGSVDLLFDHHQIVLGQRRDNVDNAVPATSDRKSVFVNRRLTL